MVKEFGDQFEEFVMSYFKRVKKCKVAVRDYSFHKSHKTKGGGTRNSPTDLDVVAFGKSKIYAISCQEFIPFTPKKAPENCKNIVDNLKQGIENLKQNLGKGKIEPVIACISISKYGYQELMKHTRRMFGKELEIKFLFDMVSEYVNFLTHKDFKKMSAISFGTLDWFLCRIVGWYGLNFTKELEDLKPEERKRVYTIFRERQLKE